MPDYTNFSLNAVISQVNGQLSLGENIGDSAGVVAAYYAYKNRKERLNEIDVRLQGLEEYNGDQIFFMGFAQVSVTNVKIIASKKYLSLNGRREIKKSVSLRT